MDSTTQRLMTSAGGPVDPFFENVTMLLHGDGTNGAQNNTFIDSSTNNFTITRNGNTTQGSLNPFGDRWSNYFDGTGDYLTIPNGAAFTFGTGSFSIEAWVYLTATPAVNYTQIIGSHEFGLSASFILAVDTNLNVRAYIANSSGVATDIAGGTCAINSWNHVMMCRTGTTLSVYLNGSRVNTATSSIDVNHTPYVVSIGADQNGDEGVLTGYISNARIIKGDHPYNATSTTYTVPTAPLTAISGTSLLTCQSNRFIDNSSNNFTITRNGDVSVRPFSPFAPSAAYSTSVNGGSGYWAGTTELAGLTLGNSLLGSSDFCIEFWAYIPDLSTSGGTATFMPLVSNFDWYNGATSASIFIDYDSGQGQFGFFLYTGAGTNVSSAPNSSVSTGASSAVLGMWHHIACTRSGATIKIYQNGVEKSSATLSSNTAVNFNTRDIYIGRNYLNNAGSPTASRYFKGYISSFRMVVGSSVYTGNFTPPVAPLTAIANTSRLLNFTNAGVVDNAADNVLETVGNAQISTSVKKYGTGSLAFDGTGDYLQLQPSVDLEMGGGDFTWEFWIYPNSVASSAHILAQQAQDTTIQFDNGAGNILIVWDGANRAIGSVSTSQWTHVALVRSSGTLKVYLNGVATGSSWTNTSSTRFTLSSGLVGSRWGNTNNFNGYIDDLRITKGVARYTANFTPPSGPFPDM